MKRLFRIEYVSVVLLISAGMLPLLAQVDSGAAVGVGVYRRGFILCQRDSHGWGCQKYTFGPCGACHEIKPNAVMDDKTEAVHRAKHWVQYQVSPTPRQKIQFGGAFIEFRNGAYVLLNREGKQVASFPPGTILAKAPNGGLWVFFPPKQPYKFTPEVEALIRSGLQTSKQFE
jgi:hypothetical protein